jgi:hypothetical protein
VTLRADRLFVLFRLADFRFAIASERVLEVREGRPGRGRLRYQGTEVARIELRERFGLEPAGRETGPGQVIIARAGEALVALHVDLIEAVAPLSEAIADLPEPLLPFLGDDVAGIGRLGADETQSPHAEPEDADPVWEPVLVLGERALAGAARVSGASPGPALTGAGPEAP